MVRATETGVTNGRSDTRFYNRIPGKEIPTAYLSQGKQGYNTLLYKYGAVSAELLKNHLQGIGRNPTALLALSADELKAQQESKSEGRYSSSDRQLNSFVRSRREEDISLTTLTIVFFVIIVSI